MLRNKILLFVLLLFAYGSVSILKSQNWIVYNTSNSDLSSNHISSISIDKNGNKWIGTVEDGVVKYDNVSWIVYNTSNSDLPENRVSCITIDENDNKWIGTAGGVARYNNINWSVYNSNNSDLPSTWIHTIVIDKKGNKWIGTDKGLAKYNDTTWIIYNTSNSGLQTNYINCVAVDNSGNIWVATNGGARFTDRGGIAKFDGRDWITFNSNDLGLQGNGISSLAIEKNGDIWIGDAGFGVTGNAGYGLVKYDSKNCTSYNTANSDLPDDWISSIHIDENGCKWFCTYSSIAKFDGINWTVYNLKNNNLPLNELSAFVIDNFGNKWIGTYDFLTGSGGLVVFNENGIVSSIESEHNKLDSPDKFFLSQNYPNPFNPSTTIKYSIPKQSYVTLKVYDILGREAATLVNEEKPAGNYTVRFGVGQDSSPDMATGVYFYQLKTMTISRQAGDYVSTKKMILLK